jgi:hypothetical protein
MRGEVCVSSISASSERLRASPWGQWPAQGPLRVHEAATPGRDEVERFVAAVYRRCYGADVRQFAPVLVSLHDEHGERVAAAGYRAAHLAPLFLERYLPTPVQTLLPAPAGRVPPRERIVEVGHLAATRVGAGRRLIRLLGPHLAAQGFEWVVSTLTQELRNLLVRMGVAPLALGIAEPTALGAQAAQWGSYYDHRPLVLAGRLEAVLPALTRRSA